MLVALEGTDGAGKTTIKKRLYQCLRKRGIDVVSIIPFSWMIPAATRVIVYSKYHDVAYEPSRILQAYVEDKEDLTQRLLLPQLAKRHVLSDRHFVSDIVYLELLWGIPHADTYAAYAASSAYWSDLTVFIDTPPAVAFKRAVSRDPAGKRKWDNMEDKTRLYEAFVHVLRNPDFPLLKRSVFIDNRGSLEDTQVQLLKKVVPQLERMQTATGRR